MKAVTKGNKFSQNRLLEALEPRQLMAAAPWGDWPQLVGMDQVFAQYPWLDGTGHGVAVVDKGIDYWHPALGGNRATNTKSPRIVNVHDYRDGDNDPFPSESEATDTTSPHATGVAGILVAMPYTFDGDVNHKHAPLKYQGILQNSLLYNLRTDRFNSQDTIKQALQWVVDHHVQYNITAVNLTDFIGTGLPTPVYDQQIKALWEAGVFIATPVANDWQGSTDPLHPVNPHQAIGYPAKSPYVFGTGGVLKNGQIRPETQRGPGLDILAPSLNVSITYFTPSTNTDTYTDFGTGNSWGTPHVVGTAVLIQQIDPSITPAEIMKILQDSGRPVVDPDGTGTYASLDMLAAIQLAYQRRDDAFDQGDGNDKFSNAAELTLNGQNQAGASGLKLLIHDDDFYRFDVTNPDDFKLTIGYSGNGSAPTGELLDADGNVVATIDGNGLTKRLATGSYYIHLYNGSQTLDGTYSIGINQTVVTGPVVPGKVGTFNDVKFDENNTLNFAWFDNDTHTLKYSKRPNGQNWSSIQIVDGGLGAGEYVSMALDSAGRPGVAYYDSNNGDLKYAHFNGGTWDVSTVDSTNTVGYYPSLQYNNSDRPAIAYYAKSGGDLKFAQFNGSDWEVGKVDTKGDVGRYPSLAMNPATGRWAIAYEHTSSAAFKFAQQTKTGGWALTVVDSTVGIAGGFTSLAFDDSNNPSFSYYAARDANLKFARFNGSKWNLSTIASKNSQGLYTNLFYDEGLPVIYYFNKTANTLNAARSNGNVWEYETLATNGGRQNHVTLDKDGFESFSWLDQGSGNLKVADAV